MIPFNRPLITGCEQGFVLDAMQQDKISGDGYYTKECQKWFIQNLKCSNALLTTSCTHALEMAAILLDVKENDEVIMPSYTFVSTANAFAMRGAKIVFVDIRPDTMNINELLIEKAITDKTKAIVPVHYAGISCEMDAIMDIAEKNNIFVVEDAAQGMMSTYKGRPLGTIGHIGTYSFHETKNYTSAGEGGLAIINDERFVDRAEIIREKGTNRSQFFRGEIDKYSWVDVGSSYLMNDISAAFLWGQLQNANEVNTKRRDIFNQYIDGLSGLQKSKLIELPHTPNEISNNGHMFYLKTRDMDERTRLIDFLKSKEIMSVFHYVPLHSSKAGMKYSIFSGEDKYTTSESERLLRLPLFYNMKPFEVEKVINEVVNFYN
ncbi:MAG: dTDP-4-amino-4,6-dideoxygalactose transaminase [Emcibacter sp.]|nr:dTDP-4-amino-4,6-dideoxygalactose transaminase [Emcibacter sp.]